MSNALKEKIWKEFERLTNKEGFSCYDCSNWHIDMYAKEIKPWFFRTVEKLFEEEMAGKIKEIVNSARKRYKCGACDSRVSNLSHTMLCQFLTELESEIKIEILKK